VPANGQTNSGIRLQFPPELPVSQRRSEIARAIADHQVVIVSGETGSGKTTQLPKILLQLGRGQGALIGHTQPRRIAARTVAERLAQETGTVLGQLIGYQVRFTDHTSAATRVKVMTDGILLAQIQRDPQLRAYDTIIIDEAHERSLNIDFLLGYLSNLLPRRPDLKLIITSATIDSELFAAHFGTAASPAPVIAVTGRTYPVEIRYRPPGIEGTPEDQPGAICAAARELMRHGNGDILVFCSGEREIRDASEALTSSFRTLPLGSPDAGPPDAIEVLPLYSRLSAREQHRVFEPHSRRRIVVATNVAETSLTVPGVHYVIDPGTARISRYSRSTKVQRLPIEPVSQASANQRAGRCGRLAEGVCIRLYGEDDFDSRPEFTEPEILRTSLAAVILQMIAVGVAKSPTDVTTFPFVQKPDERNVQDGVRTLQELGAIETNGRRTRLTAVGRQIAHLPIDPRLGRMIVAAADLGVIREVTVLAAALSIQDPRERPAELATQADQCHARFANPTSDFLGLLSLWDYLRQARRDKSSSAFRRLVRAEYLNYLRVREWQDLVQELRRAQKDLGRRRNKADRSPQRRQTELWQTAGTGSTDQPQRRETELWQTAGTGSTDQPQCSETELWQTAGTGSTDQPQRRETELSHEPPIGRSRDTDSIHKAVLSGLVSHIGLQKATEVGTDRRGDKPQRGARSRAIRNDYVGPRGARFAVFPGSALFKKPPDWVMAAELVETTRLWARTCAQIDPAWVEQMAPHLARYSYHSPRWSTKRGSAEATEKVLVYGLPVVAGRTVQLAPHDQVLARELFIRHALVLGQWQTHHRFWIQNQMVLDRANDLAARSRNYLSAPSEDELFDFYDQRIPASVVSVGHFDSWWSKTKRKNPEKLTLKLADLIEAEDPVQAGFPDTWQQGDFDLPLSYQHAPGTDDDGITVHIRVDQANQVPVDGFDWQVPGLRQDLIQALIRGLPKKHRAMLLPAQETARLAVQALGSPTDWTDPQGRVKPLSEALTSVMQKLRGVHVPPQAWQEVAIPEHLRLSFVIEGSKGQILASGADLPSVVHEATPGVQDAIERVVAASVRSKAAQTAVDQAPTTLSWPGSRENLTTWDFGDLPTEISAQVDGLDVRGYPSLTLDGASVALRLATDQAHQAAWMTAATCELLLGELALPARRLTTALLPEQALDLATSRYPEPDGLVLDAQRAVIGAALKQAGQPWTQQAYQALYSDLRQNLETKTQAVLMQVGRLESLGREIDRRADKATALEVLGTAMDIRQHLDHLLAAGWISRAGLDRLDDLHRYLSADAYRLDRLGQNRALEERGLYTVQQSEQALAAALANLPPGQPKPPQLDRASWMIEELRVSLFAQHLGTAYPISAKRITRALGEC